MRSKSKKLMALVLSIIMLTAALPATVAAEGNSYNIKVSYGPDIVITDLTVNNFYCIFYITVSWGDGPEDNNATVTVNGNTVPVNIMVWPEEDQCPGHHAATVTIGRAIEEQYITATVEYPFLWYTSRKTSNQIIIPACGHNDWKTWSKREVTPSDCTTEGLVEYTCANESCGAKENEVIPVDPNAHDWNEWTVTRAATCENPGEETRVCINNPAHIDTRSIAAIGHKWSENAVAPTCVEQGYTEHICGNDPAHNYVDTYIKALGHDYVVIKQSTGSVNYKCSRCGDEYSEDAAVVSTDAKKIASIVEKVKGQWTVTYSVAVKYADGTSAEVTQTVIIAKNGDGKIDMGDYYLVYDIKGNGSNVKAFKIVMK